jgi:hypothetical protein
MSAASPRAMQAMHGWLVVAWAVMIPVALVTGWLYSVAFVAACSIYANAGAHFGAWQAVRAERSEGD